MENEKFTIEIISPDDFAQKYHAGNRAKYELEELSHIQFCKIDTLSKGRVGTLSIPDKKDPSKIKDTIGFYIADNHIVFLENNGRTKKLLDKFHEKISDDIPTVNMYIYYLIGYIIRNDIVFLENYNSALAKLEEALQKTELSDFDSKIFNVRKDLLSLCSYYQQLYDMCENLIEQAEEVDDNKAAHLFELLANKVGRLNSMADMMTQYSIQLREMHQTKIDVRQNSIMQTLTIVTTIFMPLTLIAGWYGMNFIYMPELKFRLAYPIICIICLIIVLIEIAVFKKKKWF